MSLVLQSLALNHAFLDGNKRLAFASSAVFLRMNGYRLAVDANDGEVFMVNRVIEERADLNQIAEWIERRMMPL